MDAQGQTNKIYVQRANNDSEVVLTRMVQTNKMLAV